MIFSPETIVQSGGLIVITLVIFAETGLLVGFFLPGDTLLVAAGIFAAQGNLPLGLLLISMAVAATAGYQLGYVIGEKAGPKVFKRKDGVLFREEYIAKTQDFFTRHGTKTVLLARFVPVVRTVAPLVAGVGGMDKRKYFLWNIAGAVLWTTGLTLAAYWLGKRIPDLDKIILPLLLLAMIATTGSILVEVLRSRTRRAALVRAFKEEFRYLFKKRK